jgi:protein-tyrosine phosphatase
LPRSTYPAAVTPDDLHHAEAATPELAEELVRLSSADNFRDVAGTGLGHPTVDGGRVRRGVFFRANELRLSDEDTSSLVALGITSVADLRTTHEIDIHPDVDVPGATWHHFDVLGIPMEEMAALPDRAAAVAMMERVYRGFVELPETRTALGDLFRQLATDGVHLFHCSAGKDRTGWTAALLLHIAGVPDEVILDDYLATNDYSEASRETTRALIVESLGPDKAEVYEPVLAADAHYLQTAYDAVAASYGNIERYLTEGLGLDRDALDGLRSRLRD